MNEEQLAAFKEAVGDLVRALLARLWDFLERVLAEYWDDLEPVLEMGIAKLTEKGVL